MFAPRSPYEYFLMLSPVNPFNTSRLSSVPGLLQMIRPFLDLWINSVVNERSGYLFIREFEAVRRQLRIHLMPATFVRKPFDCLYKFISAFKLMYSSRVWRIGVSPFPSFPWIVNEF